MRAIDDEGRRDPSPASHQWTLDLTPPVTTLTSGPSTLYPATAASFVFEAETGSSFECELVENGNLQTAQTEVCVSPYTVDSLADTSYVFTITATDAAGNVESSPTPIAWTVDTVGPTVSFTSLPAAVTTTLSSNFGFAADEAVLRYECEIDGAGFATCPANYNVQNLGAGPHTLSLRAVDLAGNTGPEETHTWSIALRLFNASKIQGATMGGRSGADAMCATELSTRSQLVGLATHAFLCVSSADEVRDMGDTTFTAMPTDMPVVSMNGTSIATNWFNFIGGDVLQSSLRGAGVYPDDSRIWTGCNSIGGNSLSSNCSGWTADLGGGKVSKKDSTSSVWMSDTNPYDCLSSFYLMCMAY